MTTEKATSHQKKAFAAVREQARWIVGGYENAVDDGQMEQMPTREELAEEIYHAVIHESYTISIAQKNYRFAGKTYIGECIQNRLNKMGY